MKLKLTSELIVKSLEIAFHPRGSLQQSATVRGELAVGGYYHTKNPEFVATFPLSHELITLLKKGLEEHAVQVIAQDNERWESRDDDA